MKNKHKFFERYLDNDLDSLSTFLLTKYIKSSNCPKFWPPGKEVTSDPISPGRLANQKESNMLWGL